VPRKCDTLIIVDNKTHRWMQHIQGQDLYGAMIPQEREPKGLSIFKLFYLLILEF
jgi:hypothetical protein